MLRIGAAPLRADYQPLPGMPEWLSRVLFQRGVDTEDAADAFLNPSLHQLHDPLLLHDMRKAAEILEEAKAMGQRAVIYGDYDVDGVCAAAILREAFSAFGIPADVYLPDRHQEGYGLNTEAVRKLAKEHQVLVTVDCGITGIEETALARELGMTVIITDHHRHLEALPEAHAVITPLLGDYPFPYLCGAGVAFKLSQALLGPEAMGIMELAALATVADMVSLTGENRALVKLGLEKLSATHRPGLKALMNRAGIYGSVSSDQVAFQLAPRMNACGRMESAHIALELLLTRDMARAEELALKTESLNQERRRQETLVLEEALRQVEQMDLTETKAIVVLGEKWNSGVVGLAAGRIAERYWYPTVALACDGDTCVGSARSAGDIDIHRALSQCADLFDRFGGHKQAAGLTIKREKVSEFTRRLSLAVEEQTGGTALAPQMLCDGEMTLQDVTEDAVRWLGRLEPFGVGNPAPRFLCQGAEALSLIPVGAEGKHLKCAFQQGAAVRSGIFFGAGDQKDAVQGPCRMVMTPVLNEFRGKVTAECRLSALQPMPEGMAKDAWRECLSFLSETLTGFAETPLMQEEDVASWMAGAQGTLLLCRCLETALRMRKAFPDADFCLDKAQDPRAFHTVLLYGNAERISPAYRRVVLCDGDLGEGDGYRAACPKAEIRALARSLPAGQMLKAMFVPVDGLRRCYALLKAGLPRDMQAWAAQSGLTMAQGAFALRVLNQIDLIDLRLRPFFVDVRPMVRRGPEESALYRLCRQAKEELEWLIPPMKP